MILVTGGTGLVGSHLLFELCNSGKKVRAIKRENSNINNVKKVFSNYSNNVDALLKSIEWVDADLLDGYSLIDAMDGVLEVYHCAAMVSYNPKDADKMLEANVEGTANVVNAALNQSVKKFCYISSIAALGNKKQDELTTEDHFLESTDTNTNYSKSKMGAETEVWRAAAEGLNVVVVNPSVIIGGGNWQQSSSNMISKAYKGIKFYTEGATGFVDVRDVANIMVKLMDSNVVNEQFILNAENISYRAFFDLVHTNLGKPNPSIKAGKVLSSFAWRVEKLKCFLSGDAPLITKETAQSAHNIGLYSNKKILSELTDYTFIPVEQSIKETCKWFLKEV